MNLKKNTIYKAFCRKKKQIAILLDPDKVLEAEYLHSLVSEAEANGVDYFFVGGSLVAHSVDVLIEGLKKMTQIPVVLFPGHAIQLSEKADALLFLSLISGRNPEFLIGNHVIAAPFLKRMNVEVISTGYVLIDSGIQTSVQYMSNTKAIPYTKNDIAVATALAGEMLGNKLIYLEAGSGALKPVSFEMIAQVKQNISLPLIVGGGLRSTEQIQAAFDAGADIVVLGTALEKKQNLKQLLKR